MKRLTVGILLGLMLMGCNGNEERQAKLLQGVVDDCRGITAMKFNVNSWGGSVEVMCTETNIERHQRVKK